MNNIFYKLITPIIRVLGWFTIIVMGVAYIPFLVYDPSRYVICRYFFIAGSIIAYGFCGWFRVKSHLPNPRAYNEKPAIFMANHAKFLDYFLTTATVGKFSKHYTVVYGSNLEKQWPIFGWILPRWFISVNRKSKISRGKAGMKIKEALEKGWSVAMYPEGTRMVVSDVDKGLILNYFEMPVFEIAKEMNIDIIPVCIHKRDFCPKGQRFIKPGIIDIHVLEPAVPSNFSSPENLMLDVRSRMMNVLSRDK